MDAASESSPILMEHTCTLYIHVKDDFQSVLRSLRTLMFINIISGALRWNVNRCYLLRTTHLIFETFQNSFSNSFIDFYSFEVVS